MVNYIRKYVLLVLSLALGSNYIKDNAGYIPRPDHERLMWQGLTDLRMSLLERGMLNETLGLFKVERTRLPPIERADATLGLLNHVKKYFSLSEERMLWVESELCIYLAQSHYERGEGDKGALELEKADQLLTRWCPLVGVRKDTLTPNLDIKLVKLRCTDYDDNPLLYYQESTEASRLFKSCLHPSTTVVISHAIEAAGLLMGPGDADPYGVHFLRLLYELREFQENVLEDIYGLLKDQSPLFAEASFNSLIESNKVLEWLAGFEKKYPDFAIPNGLKTIYSRRKIIYTARHDTGKQAQEEAKIEKIQDKVPTSYGPLVAVRKPRTAPIYDTGDAPKAGIAFPMDIDEDNFFMEWVDVAGKTEETKLKALEHLTEWMLADLTTSVISEDEVCSILSFELQSGDAMSLKDQLKLLSPEATFSKLYLKGNGSNRGIIEVEEWDKKHKSLKDWLSRFSKPTAHGRQFLSVVLQEIRKDSVLDCRAPIDVRILELYRCISMVDNLLPRVKEVVITKVILWRGTIADQYLLHCAESKMFDDELIGDYLKRSMDMGLDIIREYQKTVNLFQTSMRQRMTGEVCIFWLNWLLRRPGKKISDPELIEVQEIGVQLLEQADKFFTLLLQEVTWSGGLTGVEERERSISSFTSWAIPGLVVRLLLAGGIPEDEAKRKEIWHWVQRSKARSLAKAMGLSGEIPNVLIQEINASHVCRPLYQEMVSLQNEIQSVGPQKRFTLRQKLDLHVKEMRKHRLLAEFCDVKDGIALTLSGLDRLMAASNISAVLVDWFYVYLDVMDEGSIILLTAKANSTPTVTVLSIKPERVTQWINTYLNQEQADYQRRVTTEISELIQPLVEVTQPGDTLILCPSSSLHRIPLHSIEYVYDDDRCEPLIFRNPIVYTHSHSILRMCMWNAQAAAEAPSSSTWNPLVLNGIPDTQENESYAAGRLSVKELAADLNVQPLLDEDAAKTNFLDLAPTSRLIHIHSHVDWTELDPLAHSIQFPNANALTAREIFPLSLPRGTHVSLIACSGGRARVSPEDEIMGLIPALLHAGASSTISTLWKIKDMAGADFTKEFYKKLREEKDRESVQGKVGWVDLARVFQEAVMERDKEEGREGGILHWTAFVMHGFWRFWVPADMRVAHIRRKEA